MAEREAPAAGKDKTPLLRRGVVVDSRFEVEKKIGEGTFSEIYRCRDLTPLEGHTFVALKVEKQEMVLRWESTVLRKLQDSQHVCRLVHSGSHDSHLYVAMELLGDSLSDLRRKAKGYRFSTGTTLRLGTQVLEALRDMHTRGFLHRDVKPSNFVIGVGEKKSNVFAIDFGLSKRYINQDGAVQPARESAEFRGTSTFASVNAHACKDLGRRDDLWSFVYLLVELLEGDLPWRSSIENKERVKSLKDFYNQNPASLARGEGEALPEELCAIFHYLRGLKYEDEPDYALIRGRITALQQRLGLHPEAPYDWEKAVQAPSPPPRITTAPHEVLSASSQQPQPQMPVPDTHAPARDTPAPPASEPYAVMHPGQEQQLWSQLMPSYDAHAAEAPHYNQHHYAPSSHHDSQQYNHHVPAVKYHAPPHAQHAPPSRVEEPANASLPPWDRNNRHGVKPLCFDTMRHGRCKKSSASCKYFHAPAVTGMKADALCLESLLGKCNGSTCRRYHWTQDEEDYYRRTGILPAQAMESSHARSKRARPSAPDSLPPTPSAQIPLAPPLPSGPPPAMPPLEPSSLASPPFSHAHAASHAWRGHSEPNTPQQFSDRAATQPNWEDDVDTTASQMAATVFNKLCGLIDTGRLQQEYVKATLFVALATADVPAALAALDEYDRFAENRKALARPEAAINSFLKKHSNLLTVDIKLNCGRTPANTPRGCVDHALVNNLTVLHSSLSEAKSRIAQQQQQQQQLSAKVRIPPGSDDAAEPSSSGEDHNTASLVSAHRDAPAPSTAFAARNRSLMANMDGVDMPTSKQQQQQNLSTKAPKAKKQLAPSLFPPNAVDNTSPEASAQQQAKHSSELRVRARDAVEDGHEGLPVVDGDEEMADQPVVDHAASAFFAEIGQAGGSRELKVLLESGQAFISAKRTRRR